MQMAKDTTKRKELALYKVSNCKVTIHWFGVRLKSRNVIKNGSTIVFVENAIAGVFPRNFSFPVLSVL